jgi:hypothetical protein
MSSIEDTPGAGCSGPGNTNAICDCLSCNIERIAKATEAIAAALAEKAEDACKDIDKCIDKIIKGIEDKYGRALASQEQCKAMIQQGLGGTVEYALKCAGQAREKCTAGCSPGEGAEEGTCCTSCGQEKCVCKDFECVPVEEEPSEKWIGWCNRETGVWAVTKQGQPAPGPGFVQVALADSEQSAAAQASANCQTGQEQPPLIIPPPPTIQPVYGNLPDCNPLDYVNGTAYQRQNAQAVSLNLAQGVARLAQAAGNLGLDGINVQNVGEVIVGVIQTYLGFDSVVTADVVPLLAAGLGCPDAQFQNSIKAMCAVSHAAKYIGFDPTPWLAPYAYAANAACRSHNLTPDQADAAYLANQISPETLDSLYAMHGVCNNALNWSIAAKRSKPIPNELMRMRRRKMIDPEGYQSGMRQLGFLEPQVSEQLFKLSEQVPTLAEIIRMMVRDTDDQSIVDRFGLDTEFDAKYGRQLREWSEFQGISEQHARYDWRAHWSIPSPTQLFEFYRRLRYKPEFGGKAQMEKDIKAALIQQDILPFWHDYYLAVQFRPMRLVDIRRSYQIGSLSNDELTPAYLDLGFSDADAERMAKFTRRLRDRSVISERPVKLWLRLSLTKAQAIAELSAQGIPQNVIDYALGQAEPDFIKSPPAKAYIAGYINADTLRQQLSAFGVSNDTIDYIVRTAGLRARHHPALDQYEAGLIDRDGAGFMMVEDGFNGNVADRMLKRIDSDIRVQFLKRCQQGIKQRYLMGEITQDEAQSELVARGTTNQRAGQMVDWWGCELKSGEKRASASQLCDWLARGAISSTEYLDRLKRIGYSEVDAALMLEDCTIRMNAAAQAKAKSEAKAQAQEQQRASRILEQQARQTARYLAQQKANAQKAAALKLRREKTLLSAAEKLYPKLGLDLGDSAALLRSERIRLQENFALSIDQALQALVTASNEFDGNSPATFPEFTNAIAETLIAANLSAVPAEIYIPPSTNGSTVPSA